MYCHTDAINEIFVSAHFVPFKGRVRLDIEAEENDIGVDQFDAQTVDQFGYGLVCDIFNIEVALAGDNLAQRIENRYRY